MILTRQLNVAFNRVKTVQHQQILFVFVKVKLLLALWVIVPVKSNALLVINEPIVLREKCKHLAIMISELLLRAQKDNLIIVVAFICLQLVTLNLSVVIAGKEANKHRELVFFLLLFGIIFVDMEVHQTR